jgi:hypothetical protein
MDAGAGAVDEGNVPLPALENNDRSRSEPSLPRVTTTRAKEPAARKTAMTAAGRNRRLLVG